MFYIDSQRTITRHESSLITTTRHSQIRDNGTDYEALSTGRGQSVICVSSDSGLYLQNKNKASVQKELVMMFFESMLDNIVDSWEVIVEHKHEDSTQNIEMGKTISELTITGKKKKTPIVKQSRTKKSRSKMDINECVQTDPLQQCWWSAPDEKAVIRFKNGNIYEGQISMKCMHGEGRFQWSDGTLFLGQFKDNEICGKGTIQWKDDSWYEGDFIGNIRHGKGLYVDSHEQRSYFGGWHCGTKHGQGVIFYSKTFRDSYDGDWVYNVRHGFGCREYCPLSGYKGEWDKYVREGKGMMIWPNHDFYRGDWKNGVMSGYGIYIWNSNYNNTMSLPSLNVYRGQWEKGLRNGYGILNLGLGLGSHYKGHFKANKKHGPGKFVTNNGLILQDKNLFIDDNFAPMTQESVAASNKTSIEPYKFNICDNNVGLIYHIEHVLNNIDKQKEIRANIINDYIENNKMMEYDYSMVTTRKEFQAQSNTVINLINVEDFIEFEKSSLQKSLKCYETDLKNIYYQYATICNTEEIHFTPILIRLYLWQLYYDCNVHEKGLTLVYIDNIFHRNPEWLSRSPHNPFEKIYFWQFLHSMISIASKLYAKKELPNKRPDTILANSFRMFMEMDVLPNAGRRKGRLTDESGLFISLKSMYELYASIGEPHTIRDFMRAVRRPSHNVDNPQPPIIEEPDDSLLFGRNAYIFGDEMTFVTVENGVHENKENHGEDRELKLFNFGNLSSKAVVKIFAQIFPQIFINDTILDLELEITFFEFFEVFNICAEESIKIKDEELQWREKFSISN